MRGKGCAQIPGCTPVTEPWRTRHRDRSQALWRQGSEANSARCAACDVPRVVGRAAHAQEDVREASYAKCVELDAWSQARQAECARRNVRGSGRAALRMQNGRSCGHCHVIQGHVSKCHTTTKIRDHVPTRCITGDGYSVSRDGARARPFLASGPGNCGCAPAPVTCERLTRATSFFFHNTHKRLGPGSADATKHIGPTSLFQCPLPLLSPDRESPLFARATHELR